ncbi:hypothetical protein GRI89_07065 [Altererythrobacter salegens]|uniref:Autotransporter domain-containing protein n=1 Tax=Croceibacterium salegens TaxID=1737568 RepID=A0A6I4SV87_9SPHN|nr:autotransporter outer membrane beta-barrel domain-containing protein [Croceibacterium salegens]MXO59299.1 hypothetical protein [Croceibacterium salegens]
MNCSTLPASASLSAASYGGSGGSGTSAVAPATPGTGGRGGDGGTVIVENLANGDVPAWGTGLFALSQGGNGGHGGDADTFGSGADGGNGGNGGDVYVINDGSVSTINDQAAGMFGLTQGGTAGYGGSGGWFSGKGGDGGTGGNSGSDAIGVNSGSVITSGVKSHGIAMHSVGGQGGYGGTTNGLFFAMGGDGGPGGLGGFVSASNSGTILTTGYNAKGIDALSLGGGGGDGGSAYSVGAFFDVAIGGSGGYGGDAGVVEAFNSGSINTSGVGGMGISAKSIGGGGGDGGSAYAVSVGSNFAFSFAMGGSGGHGGDGNIVSVTNYAAGSIVTGSGDNDSLDLSSGSKLLGDFATGLLAQSIGGGGGNAHTAFTVAASASDEASLSVNVALGGSGGDGGHGGEVDVQSDGSIATFGRFASGILAQSIGGGGGNGGHTFAVDVAVAPMGGTLSINLAGSGGGGGAGGNVWTTVSGDITTAGMFSSGIIAQSIAGGGGNGGQTFDSSNMVGDTSINLGVSMGGGGGIGGQAGDVTSILQASGIVETYGDMATGMLAQSTGGGGGSGGSVQTYAAGIQAGDGMAANIGVNLGGGAGNGGAGGTITQTVDGTITTYGVMSMGAVAQSIGGGGGNGGHVFAVDIAASVDSDIDGTEGKAVNANVNVGGAGGAGADGGDVTLKLGGSFTTEGSLSTGALLQSIGGGGGNGGNVHSFSLTTSVPKSLGGLGNRVANLASSYFGETFDGNTNLDLTVNVGGSGGGGGVGGDVYALLDGGTITTSGYHATGLHAQSIGGGGGNGGSAIANGFAGLSTVGISVSVGGHGGAGATGGDVTIKNEADVGNTTVQTSGEHSYGIHAQSIGGGGGAGGATDSAKYTASVLTGLNLTIGVGGVGGTGNVGGDILVRDVTALTSGTNAYGILAQTIGGGGGSGGAADGSGTVQVKIGGSGGSGNDGGTVTIRNALAQTTGVGSAGIVAQSIGGGGGNAGVASAGGWNNWVDDAAKAIATDLNVDVAGGDGGGGDVIIGCGAAGDPSTDTCGVKVNTSGVVGIGIVAQSIGGGGGLFQVSNTLDTPLNLNLGKSTTGSGASGRVIVSDIGGNGNIDVTTSGEGAIGILAQSIDSAGATIIADSAPNITSDDFGMLSATAANGGVLVDLQGKVSTTGGNAIGILGQSLSNAYVIITPDGAQLYGSAALETTDNKAVNNLTMRSGSSVTTTGASAHGIMMQTASANGAAYENNKALAGDYTGYGYDRAQTIDIAGSISVSGDDAWGIYSNNSFCCGTVSVSVYTTHILLESPGTITAAANSAGGIYVADNGNVILDITGSIIAYGGTAIDVNAGDIIAMNLDGTIDGDISASAASISVLLDGTLNGSLTLSDYGGTVSVYSVDGTITAGDDGLALSTETTSGTFVLGDVNGKITGLDLEQSSGASTLMAHGTINGTIDGAFDYQFGTSAAAHILNISGDGGTSDYINVRSFQAGGPDGGIILKLTSLPTGDFEPSTLIFTDGGLSSGDASSVYGLVTQTLATTFNVSLGFNPYWSSVTLDSIDIDFTRAGLTGNFAQMATLANAQVDAYATGDTTVTSDDNLVKYLLMGANETDLQRLQDELTIIEPSLHYGTAQSDATAIQAALNDLQSCGDTRMASVNPIVQGECYWAKYIWRDNEHLDGAQKDHASGLALGRQFTINDRVHLGVSGVFEDTRFTSATALSEGSRVGLGAILKYNTDSNFASLSVLGSYSWADGTRSVTLPVELGGETLTANSEHEALTFTTRLRGGHLFDLGFIDVTTLIDADMSVLHNYGYTEDGAGSMNLTVAPTTNTVFDFRPAAQIGKHFSLGKISVRTYAELGYRFRIGDLHMRAGMAEGYDSSFFTKVTSHREDSLPTYGLGMILDLSEELEARVNYDLEKGGQDRLQKFSAKLAFKF